MSIRDVLEALGFVALGLAGYSLIVKKNVEEAKKFAEGAFACFATSGVLYVIEKAVKGK